MTALAVGLAYWGGRKPHCAGEYPPILLQCEPAAIGLHFYAL